MRVLFALLLTLLSASYAAPAPALVLPWYDGIFQSIGQDIPCPPASPIPEIRVQGYTGFTLLPPNRTPAVGEVFYTHLVLSHPGNPCAGSAIGLELLLPTGVSIATSAENPAFCFARVPNGPRLINLGTDAGYGCPQTFPQGLEGRRIVAPNGGIGGGAWGMAWGFWLEFLIPLQTSVAHNGTESIRFRVNPDIGVVGYPSVPFFATSDVIFRTSIEDNSLTLDLCSLTPIAIGC
jgi:hypothetical protein